MIRQRLKGTGKWEKVVLYNLQTNQKRRGNGIRS
jgi:hypothetical protein